MLAKILAALATAGQAGARLAMARPVITDDEMRELARRLEASPDPLPELVEWARARGATLLADAVEALRTDGEERGG